MVDNDSHQHRHAEHGLGGFILLPKKIPELLEEVFRPTLWIQQNAFVFCARLGDHRGTTSMAQQPVLAVHILCRWLTNHVPHKFCRSVVFDEPFNQPRVALATPPASSTTVIASSHSDSQADSPLL